MHLSDFDYILPADLIAQMPLERRDLSRMLLVDRAKNQFWDRAFAEFPDLLRPTDVLVLNNTRVFPARLAGKTETGAAVEIFLVREAGENVWESLAKPLRRLKPGKRVIFDSGAAGQVERITAEGRAIVRFEFEGDFYKMLDRVGRTPLPPYIHRDDEDKSTDRERYQTVYARSIGAIAAPTAGLHFTPAILDSLRSRGITVAEITLHVGYGTFEPVRVEDLAEHRVMPERYSITDETADLLNQAKACHRRIVAVGTTTTRALEHSVSARGEFMGGPAVADLTITPGYRFRAIDGLLTNFHLPKSSLLVLVSSFAGHDLTMQAYRHAVNERYRFYSYGDCMFIH